MSHAFVRGLPVSAQLHAVALNALGYRKTKYKFPPINQNAGTGAGATFMLLRPPHYHLDSPFTLGRGSIRVTSSGRGRSSSENEANGRAPDCALNSLGFVELGADVAVR